MSRTARGFALCGLVALVAAACVHLLVLAGYTQFWAAMVHALLAGWITALILAVNYHTLPVFSGRSFPYPALLTVHLLVFSSGVATALAGLLGRWPSIYTVGLLLELIAALLFVVNVALLFTRGKRRTPPAPPSDPWQAAVDRIGTQATKLAGVCLPLGLGLLLAIERNWIGSSWHLPAEHLLTLGWTMGMVIGVTYHVLPCFSGHSVRGNIGARLQVRLYYVSLMVILIGLGGRLQRLFTVGAALLTAALGLFVWLIWPALTPLRVARAGRWAQERRI